MSLLFLSLVGVSDEDILGDYELSRDDERDEILKTRNTSTREVILDTLAILDPEAYLLGAGLSRADLDAVKERLLEPVS